MKTLSPKVAADLMRAGDVIAYPTEAVYGLGCDPFNQEAVQQLFATKQRPMEKGVILAAANIEQISDLVELIGEEWEAQVCATWPGPFTWVLPVKKALPDWITGGRDTLAVRVSAHPVVQELCEAFGGPIVSTSANPTSLEPARSCQQVAEYFAGAVPCVAGELGGQTKPTEIRDARSGELLRL